MPPSLRFMLRFAFLCSIWLFGGAGARAAFVMTLTQVGGDVVLNGSGTLDVSALPVATDQNDYGLILPSIAGIIGGPAGIVNDVYRHGVSGPTNFGINSFETNATTGSGDKVGIVGAFPVVVVPVGYISGSALAANDVFASATFASIGIIPGTYVWTWGSVTNGNADSFTLQVGPIPEPASLGLICAGLLGLRVARRKRA